MIGAILMDFHSFLHIAFPYDFVCLIIHHFLCFSKKIKLQIFKNLKKIKLRKYRAVEYFYLFLLLVYILGGIFVCIVRKKLIKKR